MDNFYINTLSLPKTVAKVKLCGGAITVAITDDMQYELPTEEQCENLKKTFGIEVEKIELKPKCYAEFDLKDIGKKGKGCHGDYDYTSGNDSPILGELKPFDLQEKCKKCKWLLDNIIKS